MFKDQLISFSGRNKKLKTKIYSKEAQALKAIRIFKGVKREDAAKTLELGKITIERFENGRVDFREERINALLRRYRINKAEFHLIISGTRKIPKLHPRSVYKTIRNDSKTYRRYRIEITKEARVLRVMRKMKKLSKLKAGKLCDMHPSCIDHRENGRTNISKADILKMVNGYGFKMSDFYELMDQPVLRDEVIEECFEILQTIETSKLNAVRALLVNF